MIKSLCFVKCNESCRYTYFTEEEIFFQFLGFQKKCGFDELLSTLSNPTKNIKFDSSTLLTFDCFNLFSS